MVYSCLHLSVEVVKFFMICDPFERIFLWLISLIFYFQGTEQITDFWKAIAIQT